MLTYVYLRLGSVPGLLLCEGKKGHAKTFNPGGLIMSFVLGGMFWSKLKGFPNLLHAVKTRSATLTNDLIHSRLILVYWSILVLESLKKTIWPGLVL